MPRIDYMSCMSKEFSSGLMGPALRDSEEPFIPEAQPKNEKKPRGGARGRTWTEGEAFSVLDKIGIDAICDRITSGLSMRTIAEAAGITKNALWRWLAADIDRSARARAARALAAWCWDEQAAELISSASSGLELGKARELAFHYRWRASKVAPKEYGDRVNLDHGGSVTLEQLVVASCQRTNGGNGK